MASHRQQPPHTIVLIHGLWMTPLSWEDWIDHYGYRGFRVLAPAWPGMDVDVEELRADASGIENLGIEDIVDHYDGIIRGLDEPPIIIGHSFGGAFTEILLDRGLGAAGVAIDAAAVRGVTSSGLGARSAFPVLKNPANNHRAVMLTAEEFHYAFTNTLSAASRRRPTIATPSPAPAGCCSRRRWRTSTRARPRASTSTTMTARLCC